MTLGVIVWKAAQRKVREELMASGSWLSMWRRVEYDAIIMGGRGGKSGWLAAACSSAAAWAAAASGDGR